MLRDMTLHGTYRATVSCTGCNNVGSIRGDLSSRREADVVLCDSSPDHRSRTCEETGCDPFY